MAELETYDELALPAGAEVVGVFVNGVPLVAGPGLRGAHRPHPPHEAGASGARRSRRVGKVLLSLGIGVYNKGDVVDLQVRARRADAGRPRAALRRAR